MMTFSKVVKKIMDERRLGVRQIARAAGMDASFFSKILSGKRSPPSEEKVIKRLARALGADYVYLMFLAGRIPSEFQDMFLNEKFILSLSNALDSVGKGEKIPYPSFSYNTEDSSGTRKIKTAPRRNLSLPPHIKSRLDSSSPRDGDVAHSPFRDTIGENASPRGRKGDDISEDLL